MKPIRLIAAFAVAGVIGVLGVAAPAAAAVNVHARASSAVAPSHAGAPGPAINRCGYEGFHFTTFYGGCGTWINWACTTGNAHSMNPPQYASNACADNVLMYQYSNFTGHTLCVGHESHTGFLSNPWRSFRVIVGGCP